MRSFLNLFGRSPFTPLQIHMEIVAHCVHLLPSLFESVKASDSAQTEQIAGKILDDDHQADNTKRDIRNNLPKSLFMPIDRGQLLEILGIQDHIASSAAKIANSTTLKQLVMPDSFKEDFILFMNKIIECFDGAQWIIKELHELLESSFGGFEAEKVKSMVEDVAFKDHEVSFIQRRLLKSLFNSEGEMSYATFILWQRIFEAMASISDFSEKLAYRIGMTLEHR
ncbi:MAG: TIGR00153 family protein [Parachlamydiaceae bacterium]|nr:TIGR00153 family protein [Parachlamydiaceae bacterium]